MFILYQNDEFVLGTDKIDICLDKIKHDTPGKANLCKVTHYVISIVPEVTK